MARRGDEDGLQNAQSTEQSENMEADETQEQRKLAEDVKETGPLAWMWEGFSVDDYNPKPKKVTPPAKDFRKDPTKDERTRSRPKATVPQPFQMTLREDKERRQGRRRRVAWEEVAGGVEPSKLPSFRANPVPMSTRLPLHDNMTQECETQRRVLREKRRGLLLATQRPFDFGSKAERQGTETERWAVTKDETGTAVGGGEEGTKPGGYVPARSFKDMLEKSSQLATRRLPLATMEKKPTFRPVINRAVPDFGKLHHTLKDRLDRVKHKMQPTVPQPFSFQVETGGDQATCAPKDTSQNNKSSGGGIVKWDLARLMASSLRLNKSALLRAETVSRRLFERQEKTLKTEQQRSEANTRLRKEVAKWTTAQKQCSSARSQRQQNNRKEMRVRSAEYQAELAAIMERVNSRPLLLQSHWQARAQKGADRRFSQILEQAGVDEALQWSQAFLDKQERRLQVETWGDDTDLQEALESTSEIT